MTLSRRLTGLARGAAGAPIDPTSIAGLIGWYDFGDPDVLFTNEVRTTPVASDGDLIKGVTDKSAVANHLTEGTIPPTYKVSIQNGLSVGRFDGSVRLISSSNTGVTGDAAMTIVIVTTGSSSDSVGLVVAGNDGAGLAAMGIYQGVSANKFSVEFAGGNGYRPSTNVTKTTWNIIEAVKSPGAIDTNTSLRLNGTLGSGGSASSNTPSLGDDSIRVGTGFGGFITGDIAELFVFSDDVSSGDLTSLRSLLSSKWDI